VARKLAFAYAWVRGDALVVGNLKLRSKAAVMRKEATALNRDGLSNEEIAARLGVSIRSVARYLNAYLMEDCRHPVELDAQTVNLMRAEQRQKLQWFAEKIIS
jgi:transposase